MKSQKKCEQILGLEKITEFLKITFNSGNLKNEKPLSVVLVAPISSGKTTLVKQFECNEQIKLLSDCTAWGILSLFQNDLRDKKIRFLIIPDMLNVMARRQSSVEQLLLFINASSEEGLAPSRTYAMHIDKFIPPFGWVLCIPDIAYEKKKKFLDMTGFSSRFFTVHYKYSQETIKNILENIVSEKQMSFPEIYVKHAEKPKLIKGDSKIFAQVRLITKNISGERTEDLRLQKNLQTFLKAAAYTRGDDHVTDKDLNKLLSLIDLIKPIKHEF